MEKVRVNLVASNLPVSFWAYAANHAADVLNRTAGRCGCCELTCGAMVARIVRQPKTPS